ncbi:MAG: aminotransferase class I/II-fold pyridoxal phosphate-dependent enzyme, partial [Oscillospiraceae bacterium]
MAYSKFAEKFDFTTVTNRTGLDSTKWERIPIPGAEVLPGFSHIPMWVADMDFPTAPSVIAAIQARLAASPSMGYYNLEATGFHKAIMGWQKRRNNVDIGDMKYISYENSVLGGVANVIRTYTEEGEPVLLHSPTYVGFTSTVNATGRKIILSELKQDAEGTYRMDFADMEAKIVENKIKVAIFCNPHNPTGRVWDKEEIQAFVELMVKLGVHICADEIWSDFIVGDKPHTPTQSVSKLARENVAAMYACTKTFNLAGLVGAYSIIYNDEMRAECQRLAAQTHYNQPNILSVHALVGAYNEGGEYVDELLKVIKSNLDHAYAKIQTWGGLVKTQRPQGTYVMFLDFTEFCEKRGKTMDEVLNKCVSVGVICQ